MNEPMPWRLQLAMAAMECPHLDQLFNPLGTVENAAKTYLLMADALLAEHAETVKAQPVLPPHADVYIRELIADLRKGPQWGSRIVMFKAANELERIYRFGGTP